MFCPACGRPHSGECDKMVLLKNELDYQKQVRNGETATAALEWSLAEIERLRKIETAARALKFSAYPAHGSGFVMQVSSGNINDLEAALAAE